MNAPEVAGALAEIAMLLEVVGGNPFRARAFQSAARRLETSGVDLEELARGGRLTSLEGVGEGIGGVIAELVETGSSRMLEELRAQTPVGLYDLMRIKGLGAKRIRTLYAGLGVDSLDALEEAAAAGKVAALPGFGAKTVQQILEGVAFARNARGRRRYPEALEAARGLLAWAEAHPKVSAASIAGDVRRRLEVANAVELVAASTTPARVLGDFASLYGGEIGDESKTTDEVTLADGLVVRLTCVKPAAYAAALIRATGSAEHVRQIEARAEERGLRLGDDGLYRGARRVKTADEDALYAALDLSPIPPELREGWGEVEAAAEGRLPVLVETEQLRGTFHCHTTWSDGRATLDEMAEAARERGWAYLGIADHSRSAGYAGGLQPQAVRKQWREVEAWNRAHGGKGKGRFRVFRGIESDILPDGSLDYDDPLLAGFDYVVGSVHSAFRMTEREMTDRLVRAVSNPRLTILGHPTGRLLLRRNPYPVDVRAVIDAAAEHGVAVEINADPRRLDMDWKAARYAAERGVLVPVNPDAHSTAALGNVAWGVDVARKGWLTARQVLNTWELEEVEEFFAQRKQARPA